MKKGMWAALLAVFALAGCATSSAQQDSLLERSPPPVDRVGVRPLQALPASAAASAGGSDLAAQEEQRRQRDAAFITRYRQMARDVKEGSGWQQFALAVAAQVMAHHGSSIESLLATVAEAPFAFDPEAAQVGSLTRERARAIVWNAVAEAVDAHPQRLEKAWGFISLALRQNAPVYDALRRLNRPIFERKFEIAEFSVLATCLAIDPKGWSEAGCVKYIPLFQLNADVEYVSNAAVVVDALKRVDRLTHNVRQLQALVLATLSAPVEKPSGLKALSR